MCAMRSHACMKCDKTVFNNEMFEPKKCDCGSEDFVRTSDEDCVDHEARRERRERSHYERTGEC